MRSLWRPSSAARNCRFMIALPSLVNCLVTCRFALDYQHRKRSRQHGRSSSSAGRRSELRRSQVQAVVGRVEPMLRDAFGVSTVCAT